MDLPTGVVTFLFTDVEGSTRLWEQHPEAMGQAMRRHDELIEGAVAANGGVVVRPRGEGDSRFVVFPRAGDAVAAGRDIQQALSAEAWPTPQPLRVRIALHTGEADVRAGDYYGSQVNRGARLRAIAYGGQTLLSQPTYDLVRDALPEQVTLRDLGEHRLKDLQRPEHVFELDVLGLFADFPPLKSLDAFPNNLPVQLTSFVGRERECAEIRPLLAKTHLLTLTGVGGTGKTRLSLQVAAELLENFADGVWFVELAPLSDPALVPQTVAAALHVREQPGRPVLDALIDYLRSRTLLLILDNCEHLIGACAQLAETLLRTSPNLKILASSREALGISGEVTFDVPSLSIADLRQATTFEAISNNDCARLFKERATAAQSSFRLTPENAPSVAQICIRLDGIPLAVELAAARVKLFTPEQIAARLDDRFRLLTAGSRTALPRQRTLRALIDWSYDLLSEPEQVLFKRLSVFVDGWTFEAAEAVCAEQPQNGAAARASRSPSSFILPPSDILDLLALLVNKSLVTTDEHADAMRYRMLETIRQYAQEKLIESGEAELFRDRHLDFFVEFAEAAGSKLRGVEQETWLQQLDNDYDNIRAALEWASRRPEAELRLTDALWRYWRVRSYFSEGREWLQGALTRCKDVSPLLRAKALIDAGSLANYQGDYAQGKVFLTEALPLARLGQDKSSIAIALNLLAHAQMMTGDFDNARSALDESLVIFTELDDQRGMGYVYFFVGSMLLMLDESAQGLKALETSLALLQEVGDKWWVGNIQLQLGWGISRQGDHAKALELFEQVFAIARSFEDKRGTARTLTYMAEAKFGQGDYGAAHEKYLEALTLLQEIGDKWGGMICLEGLAAVLAMEGEPERVTRLLGAAERLHEVIGAPPLATYRETHDRTLAFAHAKLDNAIFTQFWSEGRCLSFDEAAELGLARMR